MDGGRRGDTCGRGGGGRVSGDGGYGRRIIYQFYNLRGLVIIL